MDVLHACMPVHHIHSFLHGSQNGVSEPPELKLQKLQIVVTFHEGAANVCV